MSYQYLPYGRQSISDDDIAAVVEVLRGDWLTTGPLVAAFEERIAEVSGLSKEVPSVVSVTSCTAALHTAYGALGLSSKDEVITTPMTFIASASAAAILGASIKFVDICEDNANIDPSAVEAEISSRTKAVTGVDYAGHPIDADALARVCKPVGAVLIEDAAHSIGGSYKGRPVGSLADITTFSFFPTKNLTTAEGGAVVVTDSQLLEEVRRFARIGRTQDPSDLRNADEGGWWYEMPSLGLNYRLPDVLCALGISQLVKLKEFVSRRAALVARYRELLADVDGVRLLSQRPDVDPAWHLFPVRILDGRRREIFDAMRARGIGVQVNYIPAYWHPVFEDMGYKRGMCPVAEQFYAEELSLPLFPAMTDDDQDRVVEVLRVSLTGSHSHTGLR